MTQTPLSSFFFFSLFSLSSFFSFFFASETLASETLLLFILARQYTSPFPAILAMAAQHTTYITYNLQHTLLDII